MLSLQDQGMKIFSKSRALHVFRLDSCLSHEIVSDHSVGDTILLCTIIVHTSRSQTFYVMHRLQAS